MPTDPSAGSTPPDARDSAAFDAGDHRSYLLAIARMQLRDAALAEDVVQETLIAALACMEGFGQRASLRTWLTGILKHKILDALRARRRIPVPVSELHVPDSRRSVRSLFDEHGAWLDKPQRWGDPEQALAQTDFLAVLQDCLDKLPAGTARAFLLRELMELETAEITETLAITPNHLGVLLYRARMLLRQCLEANWFVRPEHAP